METLEKEKMREMEKRISRLRKIENVSMTLVIMDMLLFIILANFPKMVIGYVAIVLLVILLIINAFASGKREMLEEQI